MLRKLRQDLQRKEEGFTLIELLVVVIIIGILAAIAIPVFLNQREKAWDKAVVSDLRNAATAQETYLTDNDVYATTLAQLTADDVGFNNSSDVLFDTVTASGAQWYCMDAEHASNTGKYFYFYSINGEPIEGNCP